MPNARVARGRRTQVAVAGLAAAHYPRAESCPASEAGKDVRHTGGLAIEVKARGDFSPAAWMRQAQRNAAPGELPVVVMRPDGSGEGDVAHWPAFLPYSELLELLHDAGRCECAPGRTVAP